MKSKKFTFNCSFKSLIMKELLFFFFISFSSSFVFGQPTASTSNDTSSISIDTLPMNNATNSMIYYDLFLNQTPKFPPKDQSKKAIIIFNGEKIIDFKQLKSIDPKKITFLNELLIQDTGIHIQKIILLNAKE